MILNDLVYFDGLGIRWISLIFSIPGNSVRRRCYIVLYFSIVFAAFEVGPYLFSSFFFL